MPDQCSHRISPVLAFRAKTSSLPVIMYMIPSLTSGVASAEYFAPNPERLRRVVHAPFSCFTFVVSICLSVEYRWLVKFPPLVTQSLVTGLCSKWLISESAAPTGVTSEISSPRVIHTKPIAGGRHRVKFRSLIAGRRQPCAGLLRAVEERMEERQISEALDHSKRV